MVYILILEELEGHCEDWTLATPRKNHRKPWNLHQEYNQQGGAPQLKVGVL